MTPDRLVRMRFPIKGSELSSAALGLDEDPIQEPIMFGLLRPCPHSLGTLQFSGSWRQLSGDLAPHSPPFYLGKVATLAGEFASLADEFSSFDHISPGTAKFSGSWSQLPGDLAPHSPHFNQESWRFWQENSPHLQMNSPLWIHVWWQIMDLVLGSRFF